MNRKFVVLVTAFVTWILFWERSSEKEQPLDFWLHRRGPALGRRVQSFPRPWWGKWCAHPDQGAPNKGLTERRAVCGAGALRGAVAGRLQEESCCLGNRGFGEKRACERLDLGGRGRRRGQL